MNLGTSEVYLVFAYLDTQGLTHCFQALRSQWMITVSPKGRSARHQVEEDVQTKKETRPQAVPNNPKPCRMPS